MSNGSVGRGGGVYETQGRGSAVQTDGTSSAYPVLNPIAAASSNKSMPLIFFLFVFVNVFHQRDGYFPLWRDFSTYNVKAQPQNDR